jgi:hypothetical protein
MNIAQATTSGTRVPLVVSLLLGVAACSGPTVVESSAAAVTVRYGVMDGSDEATQLAQKVCARHSKIARLRSTANFGLNERYGHFDCV